jgi:hypothetical protein
VRALAGFLVVGLAVAATAALPMAADPAAARAATPAAAEGRSIRGLRYCEVLPTYRDGATLRTEVWNTMGLDDCPEQAWAALDPAALRAELGAVRVDLNGPRYWLMDRIVPLGGATASGKRTEFGGIAMELRATLETPVGAAQPGAKPYAETTVLRQTRYLFDAGKPVYALVAPDGRVFVMQTWAQIVDPALSLDDLADLGARLHLPPGWRYETAVLPEPLALEADGAATVVQDDLLNTYQLADVPVPGLGG